MATTTFTNGVTLTDASWFNDVDAITYDGTTSQILVGGGTGSIAVWTAATGTGAPVRGTSPTITTSIVSGSTTMAIFNTVATTVNAFGAASTALNIGHASGINTILGASTFSQGVTLSSTLSVASTLTLSGTAANIATGSNYISNGGTDAGLSFDASNNATLSGALAIGGALTGVTTGAFSGIVTIGANSSSALLALRNTVDGTTRYGRFTIGNDVTAAAFDFYSFATSYTASAWEKPLGAAIITAASQTGGISIGAAGGDIRLFAGGLGTAVATLTSTGLSVTGTVTVGTLAIGTGTSGNIEVKKDGSNAALNIGLSNTGTSTNDDVWLGFQTASSRNASIGIDRSTALFSLTDGYMGVGSNTWLTVDLLTGALTVNGTLGVSGAASNAIGNTASSTTNLILAASVAGVSPLRVPHGTAPSAPVDGDIWTTTAGLYVRINGATVGPLS